MEALTTELSRVVFTEQCTCVVSQDCQISTCISIGMDVHSVWLCSECDASSDDV